MLSLRHFKLGSVKDENFTVSSGPQVSDRKQKWLYTAQKTLKKNHSLCHQRWISELPWSVFGMGLWSLTSSITVPQTIREKCEKIKKKTPNLHILMVKKKGYPSVYYLKSSLLRDWSMRWWFCCYQSSFPLSGDGFWSWNIQIE